MHYTIAVDIMGGDYGPEATIPAAFIALQQYEKLSLILVGDENIITHHLEALSIEPSPRYRVCHASQRVEMDESPVIALRHKTDSSMRISLNLVQTGEADACVSAGNTGALMSIAHAVLKTLPGIERPAITALVPTCKPNKMVRLLDVGASVDIQADHLLKFAVMGLVLSKTIDHIPHPTLGLLNIGPEQGNRLVQEAQELFTKHAECINYVGDFEGDQLFQGSVNIMICDGSTGKVALKVMEGMSTLFRTRQEQVFQQHWLARLAGFFATPLLREARDRLDMSLYNGASLVGLQGIVVKSRQSADTQAFYYALKTAIQTVEYDILKRIQDQLNII